MGNFITQPTEEGVKQNCPNCDKPLVGRLTDYKGRFEDKLQWQSVNERKSHYDKEGNCKGVTTTQESSPDTSKVPLMPDNFFNEDTKKTIESDTIVILAIRDVVIKKAKTVEVDPHPGMIWEITKLIYEKSFGDKSIDD